MKNHHVFGIQHQNLIWIGMRISLIYVEKVHRYIQVHEEIRLRSKRTMYIYTFICLQDGPRFAKPILTKTKLKLLTPFETKVLWEHQLIDSLKRYEREY